MNEPVTDAPALRGEGCAGHGARWLKKMGNPHFVFGIALLVHVGCVLAMQHYRHPVWMESGAIASFMYEGKGFSILPKSEQRLYSEEAKSRAIERVQKGGTIPFSELHPTSLHSPGYPYVLYAVWKVLGRNPTAFLVISLLQALLISSLVFPLRWLTARWFGDRAAAWAMWIAALMPLYAYYATRLLPVAVFISLHPWLWMAWLRLRDKNTITRAAGVGAVTGLASLFQPLLLAIFGLLGAGWLVGALRRKDLRQAGLLIGCAMLAVAVLAPWTVRNFRIHGELVLVRCGSGPFWIGNNPHATGAAVIAGGAEDIYLAYPPACITQGTELTEIQYHRALRKEALDYIFREPGAFMNRTLRKISWFWTWVPDKYLVNRPGETAGVQFRWLSIGSWLALLVLATLARWRRRWPAEYLIMLGLYVVVYSVTYGLLHVGQARFRGEIEFILIPAAAAGISLIWSWMAHESGLRREQSRESSTLHE
ncbi:MAG: glycosyltransferase family 39 protein [Kiritimatiellae bacterium]|nr:glycosyltransferase family 39 protein [Kiritimatiellia bacterium]